MSCKDQSKYVPNIEPRAGKLILETLDSIEVLPYIHTCEKWVEMEIPGGHDDTFCYFAAQ